MPDHRIGGPVTPPNLPATETATDANASTNRSTELATAYVDVSKLASAEAGKKNWDNVNDSLKLPIDLNCLNNQLLKKVGC